MELWNRLVSKFNTFAEAEQADREYYQSLTPEQRPEILFQLWETAHRREDGSLPKLERVYRIVNSNGVESVE